MAKASKGGNLGFFGTIAGILGQRNRVTKNSRGGTSLFSSYAPRHGRNSVRTRTGARHSRYGQSANTGFNLLRTPRGNPRSRFTGGGNVRLTSDALWGPRSGFGYRR